MHEQGRGFAPWLWNCRHKNDPRIGAVPPGSRPVAGSVDPEDTGRHLDSAVPGTETKTEKSFHRTKLTLATKPAAPDHGGEGPLEGDGLRSPSHLRRQLTASQPVRACGTIFPAARVPRWARDVRTVLVGAAMLSTASRNSMSLANCRQKILNLPKILLDMLLMSTVW